MKILNDIASNMPLVSAFVAYLAAQLIKFFFEIIQNKKINFSKFVSSGGMPSSHSSSVCALTTAIGMLNGITSHIFAVSFVFSIVVMYDAMGVRRETGKQAEIINKLIADILDYKPQYFQQNLKELIGHTPFQVLCGAILGVITPIVLVKFY